MKALFNKRFYFLLAISLLSSVMVIGQTDKKEAELKKLEAAVTAAKAKVDLNQKKLDAADSPINTGNTMVEEAKNELKAVSADRKKLDKDYANDQKSANKLVSSKDKQEAAKAREDLKALGVKYRADSKAIDARMNAANKKSTMGQSNISRGKAAKANAKNLLKTSNDALTAAQKRYDAASGADEKQTGKDMKKKK